MNIPKEIDLYDWYDYAFYRAILGKPIPSPRVWDNAGRFGFRGGEFKKDNFFENDFYKHSLFMKGDLTNYLKEKYGNELRLEKGNGKLMKSDRSNHKFVRKRENNHLYLNFESFKKVHEFPDNMNLQKVYESIKEVNEISKFRGSRIDSGYIHPPMQNPIISENVKRWIRLNHILYTEVVSDDFPIECFIDLLYENIYKIFDYPSKDLFELNSIFKNDFWFIDMYSYSFKRGIFRELKYKSEKNINNNKTNLNGKEIQQSLKNNQRNNKGKSHLFPWWLPLITIPLIIIFSSLISIPQREQTQPGVQDPPTGGGGGGGDLDICQLCKITGDCDAFPPCEKSKETCVWKETWDGKLFKECKSF